MHEEIRLLWSSSSTFDSSIRLPTSPKCCKLKRTAQSFLKQTVDTLFNGERSRSKSVEEIVLQVRLDLSFTVFIPMCKASQHTLMQVSKSTCLEF